MDFGQKKTRATPEEIKNRREKLPIFAKKDQLIEVMKKHQVLIVVGETGSGKSTQLTQYLHEAGYGTCGRIGCTQPRRVAATTLATRVAEEMGCEVGEAVGYRIRFDNKTAANTAVVYMTDGILLQELANEPLIHSYAAVMLDEAHERNLNTDILLGLLKHVLRKRPELKLLVTSATLDYEKFSRYFDHAPVVKIPGKTFPVETIFLGDPERCYVNSCLSTVMSIHRQQAAGDILVFLSGQDEIERCYDELSKLDVNSELWLVPFYASLTMDEQSVVFNPCPSGYKRKVVIATNVAETSLTIDGIVYVVDSGMKKQSEFDPAKRLKSLQVVKITKVEAEQRKGRAGRTQPGKCYRLYSQNTFNYMAQDPVPEIQRLNLESAILLLAAHGVEDVYRFNFIDQPRRDTIRACIEELQDLDALDSLGQLTQFGRQISRFPLEPKLSKMLITSQQLGCCEDVLTVVSILSVQSTAGKLFKRAKNNYLRDCAKASFFKPEGDHLTLLNVYKQWEKNYYSSEWCRRNYVNEDTLNEAIPIRDQLKTILESNYVTVPTVTAGYVPPSQAIQRCILSGYFSQIARKTRGYGYITYSNPRQMELVYIHRDSALFKIPPEWVIYEELMNTGKKPYMMNVIAVEPRWVQIHAPRFYEKMTRVFPPSTYSY